MRKKGHDDVVGRIVRDVLDDQYRGVGRADKVEMVRTLNYHTQKWENCDHLAGMVEGKMLSLEEEINGLIDDDNAHMLPVGYETMSAKDILKAPGMERLHRIAEEQELNKWFYSRLSFGSEDDCNAWLVHHKNQVLEMADMPITLDGDVHPFLRDNEN